MRAGILKILTYCGISITFSLSTPSYSAQENQEIELANSTIPANYHRYPDTDSDSGYDSEARLEARTAQSNSKVLYNSEESCPSLYEAGIIRSISRSVSNLNRSDSDSYEKAMAAMPNSKELDDPSTSDSDSYEKAITAQSNFGVHYNSDETDYEDKKRLKEIAARHFPPQDSDETSWEEDEEIQSSSSESSSCLAGSEMTSMTDEEDINQVRTPKNTEPVIENVPPKRRWWQKLAKCITYCFKKK